MQLYNQKQPNNRIQTIMKNYSNNNNNNSGDNHSQDGGEKKKVFRGPFPSNVANTPIVNAITGVKYPWTVGSFGESFLWKVMNTTRFEPKLYFYDSPEQYEEHRRVKINPDAKTTWHRLQQRLGSGMNS